MKNLFFSSLFLITVSTANAQNACRDLFKSSNPVLAILDEKPVAIGEVKLYTKTVPVILANNESVDSLKSIYNQSIGIVVAHQKGYNNDHGLLRLGDYFMDRDTPGARHRGEIHRTGISWAEVKGYTQVTAGRAGSYNRIEVLFYLTPAEYDVAMIYQRMRKAAIIRPDFNFGGDSNPKNVNNRLTDCGEICFSYSTGSQTRSQILSIQSKIKNLGVADYNLISADPEMKTYLLNAKSKLLKSELNVEKLSPSMFLDMNTPLVIQNLKLEKQVEAELLNWIIGLEISKDYNSLLSTLNISNSSDFSNVNSPRASAILIYDGNVKKEQFLKEDYRSEGVFSTWRNTDLQVQQDGVANVPQKPTMLTDVVQTLTDVVNRFKLRQF